jgi:hypothetical protein
MVLGKRMFRFSGFSRLILLCLVEVFHLAFGDVLLGSGKKVHPLKLVGGVRICNPFWVVYNFVLFGLFYSFCFFV